MAPSTQEDMVTAKRVLHADADVPQSLRQPATGVSIIRRTARPDKFPLDADVTDLGVLRGLPAIEAGGANVQRTLEEGAADAKAVC